MQFINAACSTLPYSCAAMKQKATKTVKTRKVRRMEFLPCRVAIRLYKLDSVQYHCGPLQCQYVTENFEQRVPMRKVQQTSLCSRRDANSPSDLEQNVHSIRHFKSSSPRSRGRVTKFLSPTSCYFVSLQVLICSALCSQIPVIYVLTSWEEHVRISFLVVSYQN